MQHIGIAWQVRLKRDFKAILESKAWKKAYRDISTAETVQLAAQLDVPAHMGIEEYRHTLREQHFFLSQLTSYAGNPSTYDDLLDAPSADDENSPAAIKQKLLQIMATECLLNKTVKGTHAVIRSDLEWFGPSLPHASILAMLKFFGVPSQWCEFFEKFLQAPVRFKQDPVGEVRMRKRGTPISYALSVVCGEVLLFGMDFAVNQRASGLFLHRMHDDLWLWDAQADKCAAGWREMTLYGNLVGLKFNESKTGSAWVGKGRPSGLPAGDIRWGFLKFDQDEARFVIDQKDVDLHIVELRRQLEATRSVFGWVNAYNKYMAFFLRNFGGRPAPCFGDAHTTDIIDTLARIQRELFPATEGGAVGHLRSVIEQRFGVHDLPQGYFYLPIGSGGLELRNPMIEMFAVPRTTSEEKAVAQFSDQMKQDEETYKTLKEKWEQTQHSSRNAWSAKPGPFMTMEKYVSLRETWLMDWQSCYQKMLTVASPVNVRMTSAVQTFLAAGDDRAHVIDWYQRWVVSLYGEEVVNRFGGLEVVDPTLIPVGMVQLFKTSRMKLDE